jgi:hypothetical protein
MNENKTSSDIVDALKKASDGLQFMSESDYPFEAFLWEGQAKEPLTVEKLIQQTGHSQDTPVEVVNLNDFFRVATQEPDWYGPEEKETATKYQNLVETLESHLCEIQVYRVGTIEIDVYVVGKANGDLIGLSTKVVET